ncbi:hypothetical protein ILT44_07910 [Microvirga sp. BT689]|uniref:hypothetical protein n=1 Tax=Microvirga arvi TaxID=2778731 RepID=UPI00195075FB|nr:hypothetical protein [Microvirga arvi]MBM6580101.1 hypothetical protein [Microvirga arvi]
MIEKSNSVYDDISSVKIIAVNKTARIVYEEAEAKLREKMAKDKKLIEECKPLLRAFLFNGDRSQTSGFEDDMKVHRTSKGDYTVGTFTSILEMARTENLWGNDLVNAPISTRLKYFYSGGCVVKPDGSLKPYKHKGLFDIHLHSY